MSEPRYTINQPVSRLRGPLACGLSLAPDAAASGPEDGDMLKGVALITRGEALGHGLWIDTEFVGSVATALGKKPNGVKSRFTHPSLSGDGLGKLLGRVSEPSLDESGNIVRGNLRFSETAYKTPEGDLAGYVKQLADEDPEAFGASIVFTSDEKSMIDFALQHGAEWKEDELGRYLSLAKFKSPDPLNTKNLMHARLATLEAVDIVDEPAANPGGMFHRENALHSDGEALLSYILGETTRKPVLNALSADADRVAGFVRRALVHKGLEIMPMTAKKENTEVNNTDPAPAKTGKDYLAAFGAQGGVWFAEGKTWDEAVALHAQHAQDALAAKEQEIAALKEAHEKALAAKEAEHAKALAEKDQQINKLSGVVDAIKGEASPLSASVTANGKENKRLGLPDGLERFAAGIKIPTSK